MAFRQIKVCLQCGEEKPFTSGYNKPFIIACDECNQKELERRKQEHLDDLKALNIEERIAKIEEYLYDESHKPHDLRMLKY